METEKYSPEADKNFRFPENREVLLHAAIEDILRLEAEDADSKHVLESAKDLTLYHDKEYENIKGTYKGHTLNIFFDKREGAYSGTIDGQRLEKVDAEHVYQVVVGRLTARVETYPEAANQMLDEQAKRAQEIKELENMLKIKGPKEPGSEKKSVSDRRRVLRKNNKEAEQ